MKKPSPFSKEYRKTILAEITELRNAVQKLKEDFSLDNLDALRKASHKMGNTAKALALAETCGLCTELEVDVIAKINNFSIANRSDRFRDKISNQLQKIEDSLGIKDIEAEMQEDDSSTKEKKNKVVVVDDDEDLLKLLEYEFQELGFKVVGFKTGEAALEFLLSEKNLTDVFLIILDRMLPDMDGLEILQKFSETARKKVPVVILSILSTEKDIVLGLQKGAVDYITKPFSVFMLMQKAMNLLKTQT